MAKVVDAGKAKSMAKVIRFINQYPNDWIQKAFSDDKHLADHIQSKWEGFAKNKDSSYEAIVKIITSLDEENERTLMEYIDKTFEKGGKLGKGGTAGKKEYIYFYAKNEKPYVLFKTKMLTDFIPDAEDRARTVARDNDMQLAGGSTTTAPHNINDPKEYKVINVPDKTKPTDEKGNVLPPPLSEKDEKKQKEEKGKTKGKGKVKSKSITVFSYEDLSENAKEKAIEKYKDVNVEDSIWYEGVYEQWKEKLKKMGWGDVDINYSGFWSQGDGASFTTDRVDVEELMKHFKLDAKYPLVYKNADNLSAQVTRSGMYVHERSTSLNLDYANAPEGVDEKEYDKEFSEVEKFLDEAMVAINQSIYKELKEEYDYQTSDKQVADWIISNDVEFMEDGSVAEFKRGGEAGKNKANSGISWIITGNLI